MNKKRLLKRLDRFFAAKTTPIGAPLRGPHADRYVPRAFSNRGPGWGVFDRLEDRFLTDAETWAIPIETLMDAKVLQ
jgi:hypothetical protein